MKNTSVVYAAVALALAACAPPSPETASAPRTIDSGAMREGATIDKEGSGAASVTVDAPIDRTWQAVKTAYASLNIPLTSESQAAHKLGNEGIAKVRRFNDVAVSRLADCGNGVDGPRADTYRVTFAIYTTVTAVSPTQTKIETEVSPTAVDNVGSGSRSYCGSSGLLEKMIADATRKMLGT